MHFKYFFITLVTQLIIKGYYAESMKILSVNSNYGNNNSKLNNLLLNKSISFNGKYDAIPIAAECLLTKARIFSQYKVYGIGEKTFEKGSTSIIRQVLDNGTILKTRFRNGKVVFQKAHETENSALFIKYDSDGDLLQITQNKPDNTKISETVRKSQNCFPVEKYTESTNTGYSKEFYYDEHKSLSKIVEKDTDDYLYEEFFDKNGTLLKTRGKIRELPTDDPDIKEYQSYIFTHNGKLEGLYKKNNGKNSFLVIETEHYPNGNIKKRTELNNYGSRNTDYYNQEGYITKTVIKEPNVGESIELNNNLGAPMSSKSTGINKDSYIYYFNSEGNIAKAECRSSDGIIAKSFFDKDRNNIKNIHNFPNGTVRIQEVHLGKVVNSQLTTKDGQSLNVKVNNELGTTEATYKYKSGYSITAKHDENGLIIDYKDCHGEQPLISKEEFIHLVKKIQPQEEIKRVEFLTDDLRQYYAYHSN